MSLFVDVNMSLKLSDLQLLTPANFGTIEGSYEELEFYLAHNNLSIAHVYKVDKGLYPLWYYDGHVVQSMISASSHALSLIYFAKSVHDLSALLTKAWENKNFSHYFNLVSKTFSFDIFFKLLDRVPEDQWYDIFISQYVRNDFGFQGLDKALVKRILAQAPKRDFSFLDTDNDGYVEVFRGSQDESAPPNQAYSWTLSRNRATYFAVRFNSDGFIHTAKVKVEDVIDFIEDRNEDEVLLLPASLTDVKDLGLCNFNDIMYQKSDVKGFIDNYWYYSSRVLDSAWFESPYGVHGVLHAKRVLLLTLVLSYLDNLSPTDTILLALIALYHDIGRVSDDYDETHGALSVVKYRDLSLVPAELSPDDQAIMDFIVTYHCRSDEDGLTALHNSGYIKDTARAERLYFLFKDCDNLDRVHLGDLDMDYIRTDNARKLELVAYQLYRNIK